MDPSEVMTLKFEAAALAELVDRWNRAGIRHEDGPFIQLAVVEVEPGVMTIEGTLTESPLRPLPPFTDDEARRLLLPSLAELPTVDLDAAIAVHHRARDTFAGERAQLAELYNELLGILTDERERRDGALASMGGLFSDDLDPA